MREIQSEILKVTGTNVSVSTICRSLHRIGFTRKKMQNIALQRCDLLRAKYKAEVSMYNSDMLIFLDETGCDCGDALRQFGYSIRGYPARSLKITSKGTQYSTIAFMSTTQLIDSYVVEDTVDGDVFYHFVQSSLLPQLQPFNGVNQNSVVVMDNFSVHLYDIVKLINSVGALVLFLPPYSLDLNPIELCFSKVSHL